MGYQEWTTDQLEQELMAHEAERSRLAAEDLVILEELDARQVATADGCRSLSEWVASRLDVAADTAKSLVRTMRRTVDRPDLREALAAGVAGLDRVEALSRIPEDVGTLRHLDVAGVRYEASLRARVSAETERRNHSDQFLVLQPSLDESWWRLWGGLDGYSGAIVDQALNQVVDQQPALPDQERAGTSWQKAIALVQLCISDDPPPAQITVFVDADQAVPTNGEAGVVIEGGPRIGPRTLEAILCESISEVVLVDRDGTPLTCTGNSRGLTPAERRAILHRDLCHCTADSCQSRNRLQVHHILPRSEGGDNDPENLTTLCWFHHHVVVHQWGYSLHRHPEHGRIRFARPDRSPAGPSPPGSSNDPPITLLV